MKAPEPAPRPRSEFPQIPQASNIFLILVIIFTAANLVYLNAINNEFIFDDQPLIERNTTIRSFKNIGDMFVSGDKVFSYRALRTISYMIDYRLSGYDTWAYHLSNMVYHGFCAILVYFLILRILFNRRAALIGL